MAIVLKSTAAQISWNGVSSADIALTSAGRDAESRWTDYRTTLRKLLPAMFKLCFVPVMECRVRVV